MKPSGLALAFLVVFMMAIMYNSVQAAAIADADAEAEAIAKIKWGKIFKKGGKLIGKTALEAAANAAASEAISAMASQNEK
uniref:U-poneritoxin(01)-Om3a n=1 Tax=Odontomachus monticola TaxID=613454 RepID=TX13A_ODOMO|nr:RecName: Full=U-poneritoxin(01)-Om3a; Short=U-PONTX(01)-Om3a; AltName: Full=Pilosulin-like peptide 3; Short=PLP3; AltName: Full=Poneratoxin; Flags: Precursor [Odontomachus monticola]